MSRADTIIASQQNNKTTTLLHTAHAQLPPHRKVSKMPPQRVELIRQLGLDVEKAEEADVCFCLLNALRTQRDKDIDECDGNDNYTMYPIAASTMFMCAFERSKNRFYYDKKRAAVWYLGQKVSLIPPYPSIWKRTDKSQSHVLR